MAVRTLVAPLVVDLRTAGVRGVVIDWSVVVDGTVIVLAARRMPLFRNKRRDGGSAFQSFSPRPNHFTLSIIRAGVAHAMPLPATRENFTNARLMTDGRVLLVRGRHREGESLNGVFYSPGGKPLDRIAIGDIPESILVAPDNSLWVGYADEGFMNPRSHGGGIVRLSPRGKVLFSLNERTRTTCIDCYAMTMDARGTIHALCYPDFPMWSITLANRARMLFRQDRDGSQTLAVRRKRAIVDGGYSNRTALYLRDLSKRTRRKIIPVTERGREIRGDSRFGINGVLYLLEKTKLYALHLPVPTVTRRAAR